MAIRQVITFRTRPGGGLDFAEGFAAIIEAVRKEPGCLQYELFQSRDDPDRLVMVELWQSQLSLDRALARYAPTPGDPLPAFFAYLEGPPLRERYEV